MKFAYPQDPTRSVSAMRRYDESTDAATQQSNLERQQDIATVGETVPMLFCRRQDFGQDQGVNGGVWMSPSLIQLGLEGADLSMMYLLSQGEITGLSIDNVHWGYPTLTSVDPDAEFCYAYESVPGCLDLDYEPGGNISWITTVQSSGPSGTGSFTTENNCQKIIINWQSTIEVRGSGTIVGGFGETVGLRFTGGEGWGYDPAIGGERCKALMESYYYLFSDPRNGEQLWRPNVGTSTQSLAAMYNCPPTFAENNDYYSVNGQCLTIDRNRYFDMSTKHLQASWYQTSEVRMNYAVYKAANDELVTSGVVWVRHGATSMTIDDLIPDQYRVVFSDLYKERDTPYPTASIPTPQRLDDFRVSYMANYPTEGPQDGFFRSTNPGSETQIIDSSVTQTIYQQIDFPDLPGGDQQLVGGLSDLTMIGISGDITKLRPVDAPDYFIQSHLFVENGIEVERLLDGQTGPSGLYPDLVKYLMQSTKLLKDDQIDFDSLVTAARMNQRYALFFNGVLQTTNSLAEWMTRTAPYFLLAPRQINGRYGLAPIAPVNADYELSRDPIVPVMTFGHDEIVAGSYQRTYISNKDRRPICLVMVYRDQPVQAVGQTVTVEVRYPGSALSGPFEQHDMTEFCCRAEHCVYAARYILAKRRYTTHTCNLSVNRQGKLINPGDIVQVNLNVDTSDGQGIVDQVLYQVESVSEGQLGTVDLELMHFPVDADGISMIAKEVHEGEVSIQ